MAQSSVRSLREERRGSKAVRQVPDTRLQSFVVCTVSSHKTPLPQRSTTSGTLIVMRETCNLVLLQNGLGRVYAFLKTEL